MKNDEKIVTQVVEMIETLVEAGSYLYQYAQNEDYVKFDKFHEDMVLSLVYIKNTAENLKENNNNLRLDKACESAIYSLERIKKLLEQQSDLVFNKIEFELIPFLQDMRFMLYFWGYVCESEERIKKYYDEELYELCTNPYIEESDQTGVYKYDLSIYVLAYNKLEYTKLCVQSLMKYMPKDIKYELILVNHGSNDGTDEYFKSVNPTKQIDVLRNGAFHSNVFRIIEGKYFLAVSNDVLVTENAISNMLKCMESEEKVAYVVPTTPNVSNLQTIVANYETLEEMYEFAQTNNISDPYKWEQRVRLCNPICMMRSNTYLSSRGIHDYAHFMKTENFDWNCFPDDKNSLLLRRSGYKLILAKDAYCHHFGSVTLKDELANKNAEEYYTKGRQAFLKSYGVDPWGTGFCWSPALFEFLACDEEQSTNILGINCGLGSNPLKIKESLKENVHNLDVHVYNITDDKAYIKDLQGVSDHFQLIKLREDIKNIFNGIKFNYIILENKFRKEQVNVKFVNNLIKMLHPQGKLAIRIWNEQEYKTVLKEYSNAKRCSEWLVIKNS